MDPRSITISMPSSYDPDLPFFSYGIFKPGQLGYFRISEYVSQAQDGEIDGSLWIRDGIPLLDTLEPGTVKGSLIWFSPDDACEVYERIEGVEPESQYSWVTVSVRTENGGPYEANGLIGEDPQKGGNLLVDTRGNRLNSWDGRRDDPLFNEALELIEEIISENGYFEPGNVKSLLRLQMAYLLLWTSIERYASLRYGFTLGSSDKRGKIAVDTGFERGLEEVVSKQARHGRTQVRRTDDPSVVKQLKPNNPEDGLEEDSIEYYYQVRSNITHRGKGALHDDFNLILDCLQELYEIHSSYVLPAAFEEY